MSSCQVEVAGRKVVGSCSTTDSLLFRWRGERRATPSGRVVRRSSPSRPTSGKGRTTADVAGERSEGGSSAHGRAVPRQEGRNGEVMEKRFTAETPRGGGSEKVPFSAREGSGTLFARAEAPKVLPPLLQTARQPRPISRPGLEQK